MTREEILIEAVCDECKVKKADIMIQSRKREYVEVRQILCFILKTHTRLSLATIGLYVRGYDHANVLHACKTVSNLIDTNRPFGEKMERIEKRIAKIKRQFEKEDECEKVYQVNIMLFDFYSEVAFDQPFIELEKELAA